MFRNRSRSIHFVGIGGIGMSGIAELLLNLGHRVSGSDLRESDVTRRLESFGGRVFVGHKAEHVPSDVDVVVVSSAVKRANPEWVEARSRNVPVIPRAEMLAELMRLKEGIAIAGSHGKTTTTSMVATVLSHAGLDPTVVVGGKLNALGSNAFLGKGEMIVVEADESDGSFLRLTPSIAVVTNIDPEHLDHYGTFEALHAAFTDFVNKVPFYGLAVLCLDHPSVQALLPKLEKRHVTYGLSIQAEYRADKVVLDGFTTSFDAHRRGERLGRVTLNMVGHHNVLNALAALAVADELGLGFAAAREALQGFRGVQRRFTVRGEAKGVTVVDDYGHHPVEVAATLKGAREAFRRRLVVAFQPHRYTRTRDLLDDFARAFNDADVLIVTDVYAAGEEAIPGIDAPGLVERIRGSGHRNAVHVPRRELGRAIAERTQAGDLVLTLGAGDITHAATEILTALG
jgi:UDP-N-acetylmuramate--alanine ligase